MYKLKDILSRSASKNEVVVNYTDAMELLYIYDDQNIEVLGWEGWIRYPNNSLGHSEKYQGTTDLSSMSNSSAIALIKSTIMQAQTEWKEQPEIENAELLFCITTNT
tara:strand:- start:3528 stop:3848 length:321 start_codon:yes stop_codon:yes gene_type:complete